MTPESEIREAAKAYVAAAEEARTAPAVTPQITANHESAYQAFRAALEASPEGERGDVAAGTLADTEFLCRLFLKFKRGTWDADYCITQILRRFSNPTPEGPKPTGTIFELDIFREKLERKSRERRSESGVDDGHMGLYPPHELGIRETKITWAAELKDLAAELKTLIDNCMKQYAIPEGHVAVYLPVEVAERKSGKIITVTAGQRDKDEEAISRACWNATYQALSNGEGS